MAMAAAQEQRDPLSVAAAAIRAETRDAQPETAVVLLLRWLLHNHSIRLVRKDKHTDGGPTAIAIGVSPGDADLAVLCKHIKPVLGATVVDLMGLVTRAGGEDDDIKYLVDVMLASVAYVGCASDATGSAVFRRVSSAPCPELAKLA